MNRKKLFKDNMLVYGLGGIISKIIPLIMVPIITALMPNSSYYGLSDLSNTVVSLFSALALMGMYDAMYRMFFEKDDIGYKKDICSSAFVFTLMTSAFVFAMMLIFQKQISYLFYDDNQYGYLVMICAASVLIGSTNSIISAPTRMQNKKWVFLIMNTISPIVSYSISIPLILNGYYITALPLSSFISALTCELSFGIMNKQWFSFKRVNWHYVKEMLKIAIPLLPNFIFYWIFNSSDRIMITHMMGTEYSGIYAVASKFGQISQLIYTAFAGGWQYFAFSIMKDKDNTKVISKVFEFMLLVSLVTTLLGTSFAKWGVQILFKEEYWSCYICIPYLYLSPLLLMLYQIGTNQLLVIKKTWPNILILGVGALLNVALNFLLIPLMGIEGASISTFIGYFVSIFIMIIVLIKLKLFIIRPKTILIVFTFLIFFVIMRLNNFATYYLNIPLALLFTIGIFTWYYKDYAKYFIKKKANGRLGILTKKLNIEKLSDHLKSRKDS
mgnify:CR=1 FL=1